MIISNTSIIIDSDEEGDDNDDNSKHFNENITRKLVIAKNVRHIPLFSSTENTLFKFNTHLKHHLRGLMNFVSIRAFDFDELQEHSSTTWFSSHEWYGIKTYDEFKEAYTKRQNDDTTSFLIYYP